MEAVFTSASFSLTANDSHGTLHLVLGFVGIQFAVASRCVLTKFSYSSFGVPFFVFFCSVSNLFLNSNTYLSLISLLLRRSQSQCLVVAVRVAFFRRLSCIFAVTIWWSEDTPSKEEYPRNSLRYFSISCLLRHSLSVLYYCSRMWRSIIFPPFFDSLYWAMSIYFLSWYLLDVVHSYLTCCVGCICCFRFSDLGIHVSAKWLTHCVSKRSALERILFTNPSARAGYDTRSILKRILTGLNSEFSFS